MSQKDGSRPRSTACGPLSRDQASRTREHDPGDIALLGTVSDADREYFAELGEANLAARRATERPAGSLAAAFERMRMIERNMGIDVAATAERWSDRASHMAFLKAVKDKIAVAGTRFGVD